jgi:hypothetical protein
LGQRVVLAVYGLGADAPLTPRAQVNYAAFLHHVLQRLPGIRDVVVWNEANNPTFWPTDAGAAAYEQLLARSWDALHSLGRPVNVIDSTAPHQNPGAFLLALGRAYRASGRTRPILDTYGHNVYPANSAERPWATHTDGSIDEGDYALLIDVLTRAFAGTAQPLPGQGTTRIWYLEDGFQTQVPPAKLRFYVGRKTDRPLVPSLDTHATMGSLLPLDQATQLRMAIELAYCQPAVAAFFNFQLLDDHHLSGWQSGLLWADGTPKPSASTVQETIAAVDAGTIDCATVAAETRPGS